MSRSAEKRVLGLLSTLAAVAALVAVVASATAAATSPKRAAPLEAMVRFLQEHQQASGGYAEAEQNPTPTISAWVTLGVAAAGVNPLDQVICGTDALTFLERQFEGAAPGGDASKVATTALERELLVVDAAGTDPHAFASHDLVGDILSRQLPDGSIADLPSGSAHINDAIFGILALSLIHEPAAEAAVGEATEWLLGQQNEDGGWSWQAPGAESEVDIAGAAIEALNAAGRHGTAEEEEALKYLRAAQLPEGGFPARPGIDAEANIASTAWAVQGIWAAGENPEEWRTGSGLATEEPLDYMESLQQPDGHVRWKASADINGIWMTAYVAPAFAGRPLPIAPVPRAAATTAIACTDLGGTGDSKTPRTPPPVPPEKDPEAGNETDQPDPGVIAGGGGDGARDFSRPLPQSKGQTPGGARNTKRPRQARDHSLSRRGENSVQASGTETNEPGSAAEAAPAFATVGGGGAPPASAAEVAGTPDAGTPGIGGEPIPEAAAAARNQRGEEVTGALVGNGTPAKLAFGAPGLRSGSGGGGNGEPWVAIAIGLAAAALALAGAQWERLRPAVLP